MARGVVRGVARGMARGVPRGVGGVRLELGARARG
jgi:hypothetical protein